MADVMSKSAFAAHRGVATSAVSNWISRGKLSGAALTADGRIAVEEADRQLGQTIDPGRGAPPTASGAPSAAAPEVAALATVRLEREGLKLEEEKLAVRVKRGELTYASEVERLYAAKLNEDLAALELFVLELPIKLGQGREGVDFVRREWREFRIRRQAQATVQEEVDRAA